MKKQNIFGFSNGGTTALQIAIRYPERVNALIAVSALSKRDGVPSAFWNFMEQAQLENMPQLLQDAYKEVAADPGGLQIMHDKDAKRMVGFKDIPDKQIQSIKTPTLIIAGEKDIITPEHAAEMHRLIPNSQLAIIHGGHGEYISEITTLKTDSTESDFVVPMNENFLNKGAR
ncbi:alpha/beta fold hydrolase [Xanthocytophaga agilis]|uniref:Alpha/beta fold hydrolase n=1 Tax=Xanthocytophaga agilis TaxID=3048010 RepID=A0AAE3RCI7_9BACT|nr:alpha/beta fold hydrolase [Xanthocytophaga agilis]MDJ1505869.1 alpha/beta fold hydrolase [Xanthocytophaga agilis]